MAIPLESFVQSLRTVVGMLSMVGLRFLALTMRVIGNACWHGAALLQRTYDLLIFLPLWIEDKSRKKSSDTDVNPDLFEEVAQ